MVACLGLPAAASAAEPADYVDPMIGTAPPGFVFPGAAAPFGMVQNSPDTTGEFAYGVHIAARVSALAGPSEGLVSRT